MSVGQTNGTECRGDLPHTLCFTRNNERNTEEGERKNNDKFLSNLSERKEIIIWKKIHEKLSKCEINCSIKESMKIFWRFIHYKKRSVHSFTTLGVEERFWLIILLFYLITRSLLNTAFWCNSIYLCGNISMISKHIDFTINTKNHSSLPLHDNLIINTQ